MKIAVIGAGNVGATLGRRWAGVGHEVVFGVRDPASVKTSEMLNAIRGDVSALTARDALRSAPVAAVCLPWTAVEELFKEVGALGDVTLIDTTNPITLSADGLRQGLLVGGTTSAAEQLAGWAGPRARVVKALNTTGAPNMDHPIYGSASLSAFLCGDDATAKRTVKGLVSELGFDPVDVGPLTMARYLEPMAMLWITMAVFGGFGQDFGFRLMHRPSASGEPVGP
ncbi:MAG: NADPH-dependent F420 reductase [Planctomycetia bacterium]